MNPLNQKSCSICGEGFGCGAKNGAWNNEGLSAGACWCEALPQVEIVEGNDCYCPKCLARVVDEQKQEPSTSNATPQLVEDVDYYLEGDALVFTASYHLRRGYCCESGCRHCPYGETAQVAISSTQK
jgi:hypothetical protein